MHTFKVGDRVKLLQHVDRYPDFLADEGMTGTVDTVEIDGSIAVRMDKTIEGCEPWDNCICWYEDRIADIAEDLALISEEQTP